LSLLWPRRAYRAPVPRDARGALRRSLSVSQRLRRGCARV